MSIKELLATLYQQPETLTFDQIITSIDAEFDFTPMPFSVGSQNNGALENHGSAKVLAFAHSAGLSPAHTLMLFAEHYRDVLANPEDSNHQNIRQFQAHGWKGVSFAGKLLVKK